MRKAQWRKVAGYVQRSRYRSAWRKIVQAMACIVVFCTTYALILPAITMENTYFCGMESHEHSQACYTRMEKTKLVCELTEQPAHVHNEGCYEVPEYACGLEETPPHTHIEECTSESGELICALEENAGHVHGEECLAQPRALICGQETEGHTHGEECYTVETLDVLVCEQEVHVHGDTCRSNPEADLETREDWEATLDHVTLTGDWAEDLIAVASSQVGYQESEKNYLAEEGREKKGYTRYGEWFGAPYGDWDAMFVSFCLRYADIPQDAIVRSANSGSWLEHLRGEALTAEAMNKVPEAGDLLFYRAEEDAPVRSAIVLKWEQGTDSESASLRILEGDWENQVAQRKVYLEEIVLEGCCGTKQIQQAWNKLHDVESFLETESTENTEATESTQSTENTEATESTQSTENTEATKSTESTENTETTESTQSTENTEATESTTESTENTESTESTESTENTEPTKPMIICQTRQTENYIVTVRYSEDLVLPAGTELRVVEYPKDSELFRQRCEEAGYELEWLLNIGFFLEDQELPLDGAFDVMVTSKQGEDLGQDITHFTAEGAERIIAEDASEMVGDGQSAVLFSAESFSDFGGGVAPAAETDPVMPAAEDNEIVAYHFTTVNPASLQEGVDYVIYTGSNDNFTFLRSDLGSISANGTGYWSSPYNAGGTWTLLPSQLGTTNTALLSWRVVKNGSQYYLVSQNNQRRLTFSYYNMSLGNSGTPLTISANGTGATVRGNNRNLYYSNGWSSSSYSSTTVYFAQITPGYPNYPAAVETGEVHVDRLRFYNICEHPENGIGALPGCEFLIEGTTSDGRSYSTTIISGSSPQLALPGNIPDGKYTITEVSAAEGYMRDLNHTREFWIENGALVSEHNIGTFLNHSVEQLTTGKTGQVADYNNRIYQILLNAKTNLRMYYMDPIEVLLVVDKSNSMLFPSGMNDTGKSIRLTVDDRNNSEDDHNKMNNIANNRAVLDSLDKGQVYYIIADPEGTSTVYAVWHDGITWMYQDASYYAKAKFENGDGYQSDGEIVIFPSNKSYAKQAAEEDVGDTNYRSNGGGLDYSAGTSTLGNYINSQGGTATFQLYTAKDQYNRLHYLEEAMANMIYELADANSQNRVVLIPFTKEVQAEIYYEPDANTRIRMDQPVTLTTSNVRMLSHIVTHIDTLGGTRQDLALEHAYDTYLKNDDGFDVRHTYTILITDGAPVRSGSSAPPLGTPNSRPTTADDGEIYGRIKGWGAEVREESTLMTVALGMEFVEGGRTVLQDIATSNEFYCALDDASALTQNMQKILFDGMKDRGEISIDNGIIEDEITDSFYPIAWTNSYGAYLTGRERLVESGGRTWLLLREGDWITLEGKYTTEGASDAAGQLMRREDGTYYIRWENQTVSGSGWKGTFYVKAKEDFIGGNAIDTNKEAFVTVNDLTRELATPTVNVHLLDMNENSSEVTVYLGDTVNGEGSSPRDVLRAFYSKIGLTKVQEESRIRELDRMNRYDPAVQGDGLETNFFYLKYALGYQAEDGTWVPRELTDDEWTTLESGGSLTFPYVYEESDSHGNVGYFTISLNKTSDTYDSHPAQQICQPDGLPLTENCQNPAETYTLIVTYTAYELGEQGRPEANVNNGSGSPGLEVTKTAQGLNNGQGIVTSENIHEVHVISGRIVLEKVFTQGTEWVPGETFAFQLADQNGNTQTKTVTIGQNGTASVEFYPLSRGTYTVTEALDDEYAVKSVAVGEATNSYYTQPDPMQVTFTMGNNLRNENVIGKAGETDAFTSYIDPVNGVYGEAVFANAPRIYTGEIPVEKIWDDGPDRHQYDSVHLVLYRDNQPMLDAEGNARLLRVDASTNWKGVFTVVLADKNDSLENYNYSVCEVSAVSEKVLNGWYPAILENDGQMLLYYQTALEESGILGVNGIGYIVSYAAAEDGTLTVTNLKGFDLPETGGMGTQRYTISGLAVILAALMYGCGLRRKRERGQDR